MSVINTHGTALYCLLNETDVCGHLIITLLCACWVSLFSVVISSLDQSISEVRQGVQWGWAQDFWIFWTNHVFMELTRVEEQHLGELVRCPHTIGYIVYMWLDARVSRSVAHVANTFYIWIGKSKSVFWDSSCLSIVRLALNVTFKARQLLLSSIAPSFCLCSNTQWDGQSEE